MKPSNFYKKTGKKLLDMGVGNAFLDMKDKAQATKAKDKQVELYEIKNQQNEKAAYGMGKNI